MHAMSAVEMTVSMSLKGRVGAGHAVSGPMASPRMIPPVCVVRLPRSPETATPGVAVALDADPATSKATASAATRHTSTERWRANTRRRTEKSLQSRRRPWPRR